ncbi:MAG: DNA polymerase I [Candidatus Omnitrophica bacterium]|nr:DNA polymerase I [Candidatus Omnitrophota bacterium]
MSQRVFIIDAHGLCYRAYYAVKALKNSKGLPTNAVFGFCNMLRKMLLDFKPTHVAVCFDVGRDTHRQKKFADYKIQRQAMPDDLVVQIKTIREVISAYNIPIFELEGYEADDVMATLALRFAKKDAQIFLATDDKDMAQLVGEHIKLYSPRQEKEFDGRGVEEKFGVAPKQITDYIALAGDASDNIPGVKGIGEKGARKLIAEYKSLEGIYEHIDRITPAGMKEKLIVSRQEAFLSKELATLHADVPVDAALGNLAFPEPDRGKLFALFNELEFRKLAEEYAPAGAAQQLVEELKAWVETTEENQPLYIVYDLKSLRKAKAFGEEQLKHRIFDVYLADYLLSGGQGQYHLPALRTTGEGMKELYTLQKRLLKEQGLEFLFYDVEMPLSNVLFEMETNGVRIDAAVLERLSKECAGKMAELEGSLYKIAGGEFNVNSPKQLSIILFERLKLPVIRKTKTGFSTDEEVLTRLSGRHPLPALILEYRQMAKLKSTYIDALPQLIDPQTKRLHTTFNQAGAETGRLSSNNPNLQNIPIRTEFGQRIRRAFVPYTKGHVLLSADYSQIELRILGVLSKDEELQKACRGEGDIHRHTASLMFEVPESKVDEKMRYAAKRINFGIVYGMGAFSLAKDLNVSVAQAQDFIDKYFLRYPKVRQFLDGQIQKARDLGYVTTFFGRRRYLPDIHNRNMGLRQFAERQAINAPMQGTAADIIKIAMVKISRRMAREKLSSTMTMTVHDELVFDVPQDEIKTMASLVREEMEGAMDSSVPIKTTIEAGSNWLEMEKSLS